MSSLSRMFRKACTAAVLGLSAAFLLASPAAAQQSLSLGQSVQGTLAQGDSTLSQGEFVDAYAFQGRAGQTITVRMASSDFDAYIVIIGPNDYGQENDDETPPNTNSGLTVTLPANGAYTIMATSLNGGETGRYTLQVTGAQPQQAQQQNNSPGGSLQLGQSVRGSLAAGDQQLNSGEYADSYTFRGQPGQQVTIDLASTEFDAYLMVRGTGLQEDNDDDPAARGSTNSQLTVTVPSDGAITVRPTSYRPGETGAYTLSIRAAGGGQSVAQAPQGAGVINVGQSASGRLQQGDATLQSGEFRDTFTLNGRRGQQLEVRLESSEFDPYVAIVGPNDFSAFNDDDAENGTRNSRMLVTLPEDGPYIIMATSYAPGESGAYRIAVAETNEAAPGQGSASTADALQLGRTVNGALAQGDTTLRSGEFTDSYRFRGQAGQRVTIDMASSQLDAYVILVSPSGAQEDNDDAPGGGSTNSQLDTVLAETGDYTVIATSYRPGESGAYTLRVASGASSSTASGPVRQGRVFAVMVGISDYQGFANNLDYTNEDAVKMGEALRRAGVLADQSIVITDGQATRANVIAAFQRVAAQAGPNDTFLFFFSGHGTQTQAAGGANEPDGRDESIVMVDGLISDDEMAQLFSSVRAGTSLIALDSCFSGGFARDVVANPGVMGLFSSEEDLTSAVADKFQAGGYLSLFLRDGLSGEADSNHNRVVTAGELSVYLRQQFAEHAQGVESSTMEGQRNYQFLVVDRGGVRVDDQVIALRT